MNRLNSLLLSILCTLPFQPQARETLSGGETELKISKEATKDAAYLTPLPVEYPDAATVLPEGMELVVPFVGEYPVGQGYGYEASGWTHQTINNTMSANDFFALDIAMPEGTPILAAAPGRILTAQDRRGRDTYGIYVVIDHGEGIRSIYAHLSDVVWDKVRPEIPQEYWVWGGDPEIYVKAGEVIGWSGKTGTSSPHLHFVMHKGSFLSESGADISGMAVRPEPLGGYVGIRRGHMLKGGPATAGPLEKPKKKLGSLAPGQDPVKVGTEIQRTLFIISSALDQYALEYDIDVSNPETIPDLSELVGRDRYIRKMPTPPVPGTAYKMPSSWGKYPIWSGEAPEGYESLYQHPDAEAPKEKGGEKKGAIYMGADPFANMAGKQASVGAGTFDPFSSQTTGVDPFAGDGKYPGPIPLPPIPQSSRVLSGARVGKVGTGPEWDYVWEAMPSKSKMQSRGSDAK